MARYLAEPDEDDITFAEVMNAFADDARLRLLAILADGEYHPCGPDGLLGNFHKSTLSHHKRILREAGVTRTRLEGRNYYIRLRREALDARFPGLLDAVLNGVREFAALVEAGAAAAGASGAGGSGVGGSGAAASEAASEVPPETASKAGAPAAGAPVNR